MTSSPVEAAIITREIRGALVRLLNCSLTSQQRAHVNLLIHKIEFLLFQLEHELAPRQREVP
jgi:hypothetical protein